MAATDDDDPGAAPPIPARRRWAGKLARVGLGLGLGLGLAEAAFHLRDHGAFPHLNVYVADARLGVRLRPLATQRIAFGDPKNPVTRVRINHDGLRGADLPPPTDGEILVVGDSQVFGLGVEEHETASAALARALTTGVVNAGVPTYGPLEYNALLDELLARRRVATVVYVVNLVNDLFEASHPNVERHVVWDGWAVRKETAPPETTWFPGREVLFGRSHLVYALRAYLHEGDKSFDLRGFASEGTASDLLGVATEAGVEHARTEAETKARKDARDQEIQSTTAKELAADLSVEDLALDAYLGSQRGLSEYTEAVQKSRNNPGDILVTRTVGPGEEGRGVPYTAKILYNGAKVRREMEARIRVFAELAAKVEAGEDPGRLDVPEAWTRAGEKGSFNINPDLTGELRKGRSHPLLKTFEEREALRKRLADLRAAPVEIVRAWSPIAPLLRAAKAACDARGARLLVVALPMDVQVSSAEWSKYTRESTHPDMEVTRILLADIVASAEAIGALGLDATPALAAAEPGAFLLGDIHMTPKGHAALAAAIAAKLGAAK